MMKTSKWLVILKGIGIYFGILLPVAIILAIISLFLYDEPINVATSYMESLVPKLKESYGSFYLLLAVIIGPLFEEVAFRLGISFKKRDVSISLCAIFFLLSSLLGGGLYDFNIYLIIRMALCVALYFLLQKIVFKNVEFNVGRAWQKFTVVVLSLLFASLHLFNFDSISWDNFLTCSAVITRMFAMGIALSYIRLNLSFWSVVIIHILNNAIAMLKYL